MPRNAQQQPHQKQQQFSHNAGRAGLAGGDKGDRNECRWWTNLQDICPVSGFPIRLLPYPPFKLHVHRAGRTPSTRLIDGCYFVLSVLHSWCFEAFGVPLSSRDIESLDTYMKRCKLGPFRLGRALELAQQGVGDASKELEALRARAERRLDVLKHVQQVRLERGEDAGPRQALNQSLAGHF